MTSTPVTALPSTPLRGQGIHGGLSSSGNEDFLVEAQEWCPQQNKSQEALFAQGNGYLHVRASFEEGLASAPQNLEYERRMESVTVEKQAHPLSKVGTFVPSIMGKHPLIGDVTVNLPNFLGLGISVAGERFDMERSAVTNHHRHLDLATGVLVRSVQWHTAAGPRLQLTWRRFPSWSDPHLFVQELMVRALDEEVILQWDAGVDAGVTTNGYRHFVAVDTSSTVSTASVSVTTDYGDSVAISTTVKGAEIDGTEVSDTSASISGKLAVVADRSTTLTKLTSIATTNDAESVDQSKQDAIDRCLRTLRIAADKDWAELLSSSTSVFTQLWERADIEVEPAGELQKKLRWCIYHLLRCTPVSGGKAQVCPKGFAGEAYYGRFFWDSEIYLLPFYLHTNPAAARDLLLYRFRTLNGARDNARRYGMRGAKYPWQSGVDGREQCSLWEYADNELHISADIAYAIVNYVNGTGDIEFMDDYGLEMLLETALYWVDRVDFDSEGVPHLLNIMGPDEYSPMSRDNAFTNRMVQFNCAEAVNWLEDLTTRDHASGSALMERLGVTETDLAQMRTVAATLPIPRDTDKGLVLQSADFPLYADIDIDALWQDKSKAFGFSVTQDKIYRSKCIKQADVTALMTLFPADFTDEEVEVAYDYYTPYVVHDSSLSPAGHSVIANRLGRDDQVEHFLDQALAVDFDQALARSGDGIHIANCAMIWQLFVHGIAGLSNAVSDRSLTLRPRLLPWIESLQVPLAWGGETFRVRLTPDDNHITLHPTKDHA